MANTKRFIYEKGDIEIKNNQCEFCKYNDIKNQTKCTKFKDGKPVDILSNKHRCKFLDIN